MNEIVKPYLFRASLLAAIAIVMGVALSVIVYLSSDKVRINAIDLVENRLPILTSINRLFANLSEQERIIYEYYRSQNSDVFIHDFTQNKESFAQHSIDIVNQPSLKIESAEILLKQKNIESLSEQFHQAMQLNEDNWDHLRELLTEISSQRRQLLPTLLQLEAKTEQAVNEGHSATLAQVNRTHWTVVFYGVGIVLLGGVVSWTIKQYILTNAKNTRLALFPHRNPNAIISVNNLAEVVYSNPACQLLLENMDFDNGEVYRLIPNDFLAIRAQLIKSNESTLTTETQINDFILQINVYWFAEIDAYDIHIVDISQQKLAEREVKQLAFYMQETNLPNQYKLNNDVDLLINQKQSLSLGIFEIRQYSKMVTSLGGESINELVKVMTEVIVAKLPRGVKFYHINDNQFALLCTKTLSESSLSLLSQEITNVAEQPLITSCGELFIELDFGYCLYPEHGKDKNTLFKNAHTALAISIADEHNKFSLFNAKFSEEIHRNADMVDNLRNAIALNELFLVFQPQLDLKAQRITGIETLVRWRHGEHVISPAHFIPLAEQSGLIVPIGQWILNQACLFTKELIHLGHVDMVVAVNVSPRQFSHPNFIESVIKALKDADLPAKNLELEITEGVVMQNEEATLAVLHQLKALGIQLSIDDFGTGYSSLSYLKRFPVDKLKIDQSFIFDCHKNSEDKAIVNTIVSLGKNLGLSLIAEGVEESEHVEFLKDIDCDEIQGYWFSRPLEATALTEFLQKEISILAS